MTNQKVNQNGSSSFFMIMLSVAVIAMLGLFLFSQGKFTPRQLTQNAPSINSTGDLDATSTELDNFDMRQFNNDLNQLSNDASTF